MPDDLNAGFLTALRALDAAVSATARGDRADLAGCFRTLEELERQLPSAADPRLKHYLANKSYQKARLFLEAHSPSSRA